DCPTPDRNTLHITFNIVNLKLLFLATWATLLTVEGKAQEVFFETEYLGNSGYYFLPPGEQPREKIGDGKGSAMVYQAGVGIPLSMKLNENNRPTAWGIGFGGAYVSLKNQNFSERMVSEIMNLQLGVYHLRPLNDKWSFRANVEMGNLMRSTDFAKMSFTSVLVSCGVVVIRHLNHQLRWEERRAGLL